MQVSLDDSESFNRPRLDPIDERILWELVREARIPNNLLAERVGVSPSTALTRVKALRDAGVLRGTHASIDARAVGLHIRAVVAVRIRPQARDEIKSFAQRAIRLANVISISFLSGVDDFHIEVACTDTSQLRDFVASELSMDPAVATTNTSIVFDHLDGNEYSDYFNGFEDARKSLA